MRGKWSSIEFSLTIRLSFRPHRHTGRYPEATGSLIDTFSAAHLSLTSKIIFKDNKEITGSVKVRSCSLGLHIIDQSMAINEKYVFHGIVCSLSDLSIAKYLSNQRCSQSGRLGVESYFAGDVNVTV